MSPIVWDLGHIANFEEQWIRRAHAPRARRDDTARARDSVYDAVAHPRSHRGALAPLAPDACRRYLDGVRAETLAVLRATALSDDDPLLGGGFVHAMLAQHEAQDTETVVFRGDARIVVKDLTGLTLKTTAGLNVTLAAGAVTAIVDDRTDPVNTLSEEYLDDDNLSVFATKRIERKKRRLSEREKRVRFQAELVEHAGKVPLDAQQHFNPSFQPARHERVWLLNYLESFYNAQIITDILGKVKGGKEANVYCCAAHPSTGLDLIAAKVYRPRMFRNLRNDSRYRQGRPIVDEEGKQVFNRHEVAAVQKNTRFGQEIRHMGWLGNEFQTMQLLYEAGADVLRQGIRLAQTL